jgi:hypothetical protein
MSLRPGSINLPWGHRCCRVGLLSLSFCIPEVFWATAVPNRVPSIIFGLTYCVSEVLTSPLAFEISDDEETSHLHWTRSSDTMFALPGPVESSPCPPPCVYLKSIPALPFYLRVGIINCLSPHSPPPQCALHVPPSSFFSIYSDNDSWKLRIMRLLNFLLCPVSPFFLCPNSVEVVSPFLRATEQGPHSL